MNLIQAALSAQTQQSRFPTISMEQELLELGNASDAAFGVQTDLAEMDRANSLVDALEDLDYVVGTIQGEPTAREASLIQIVGDTAMAGTGADGSAITPAMEDSSKNLSVRDKIEAIVKTIREALIALVKKVSQFISSYTTISGNVRRRVEEVGRRLRTAKDSGSSEKFKFTSLRRISDDLGDDLRQYEQYLLNFIDANQASLRQVASVVSSFASGEPVEQSAKQVRLLQEIGKTMTGYKEIESGEFTKEFETDPLLGGIAYSNVILSDADGLLKDDPKPGHVLRVASRVGFHVYRTEEPTQQEYEGRLLSVQELQGVYRLLEGLVKQVTDANNKRSLLGAMAVRRDFQERFAEQMSSKLTRETNESSIDLAGGVQSALTAMAAKSTAPYVVLVQTTSGIINQVLSSIAKSLDEHERRLKDKPEGTVATEGFKDWVKDLFSHRVDIEDAGIVRKAVTAMQDIVADKHYTFNFHNASVANYLYKNDRLTPNLPREIGRDAENFKNFIEAVQQFNSLFAKVDEDTTKEEAVILAKKFKTDMLRRLTSADFLGNMTAEFHDDRYNPDHTPSVEEPELHLNDRSLIGAFIDIAIYGVQTNMADKFAKNLEKEFTKTFDPEAFLAATKKYAAEFEAYYKQIEEFVGHATRLKKHDQPAIRDLLRFGHNVAYAGIYVVWLAGDFYDSLHSSNRGLKF